MSFIDLHCHILPSMDDGPDCLEDSLKMLSLAKEDGVSHIFATPHILDGVYPYRAAEIMAAVEELRRHLPQGIELHYGADVRVTPDLPRRIEEREVPTLNDSGYVLVELPDYIIPPNLDNLLFELVSQGIRPVITHPERHGRLMHDLVALRRLRGSGALCQITAMSITGGFGREVRRAVLAMLGAGVVDIVASDAHNVDVRPPVLSKAYKEVKKEFGGTTADIVFFRNPGKILESGGLAGLRVREAE